MMRSHDRIATHILAAEGDSKWTFFDGNYQAYEADKKKRLGDNQRLSERCFARLVEWLGVLSEGAKPKRIRYKPIGR